VLGQLAAAKEETPTLGNDSARNASPNAAAQAGPAVVQAIKRDGLGAERAPAFSARPSTVNEARVPIASAASTGSGRTLAAANSDSFRQANPLGLVLRTQPQQLPQQQQPLPPPLESRSQKRESALQRVTSFR